MAFHQEYLEIAQPAVGEMIRELRHSLAMTQEKFAAYLGVTFPTINRWENGHVTPSRLALQQIERLLNQWAASPDATLRERSQAVREKYFAAGKLKA